MYEADKVLCSASKAIWLSMVQPAVMGHSKYTININTEMNYWPAEVTNLSETHGPLFSMLKDLSVTGAETPEVFNSFGSFQLGSFA